MIPQSTIEQIFSVSRIEEIVGEYVQLKRAGANLKGLSPFVSEKTPSFIVSPSKQIFKDFSSGKGGDVVTFLKEIENFSYPEALCYLGKRYNIEVKEYQRELSDSEKERETVKEQLYKIHDVANDFFQLQLNKTEEGKSIGLSYFKERELRDDIIKKFQLGYSPEKKNTFTEFALDKAYSKELLEKSGLSIFPENSPSGIDRFRDRVVFPIHSFSGRVLGFGARILKNNVKTAKYLNSPETEIYHKSNVLYGLNQGKQAISRKNLCLLVEGYMDVVSLHQSGIENVVASSGTSLTTEQIKLIKRLTENVTILFDGDNAGIKASFRSIDMLLSEGMNIRVLLFPNGDDPDSFARKHPQEYVETFIDKEAKDFIEFKADILLKDAGYDPIKKADAIRDIMKSVSVVSNEIKREIYIQSVSGKFNLTDKSLKAELVPAEIKIDKPKELVCREINPLILAEDNLTELLLKYGDYVIGEGDKKITVAEKIIHHILQDDIKIQDATNRKIIGEYYKGIKTNKIYTYEHFLKLTDNQISAKLASVLIESPNDKHDIPGIVFSNVENHLENIVEDAIHCHKLRYIDFLIGEIISKKEITDDQLIEIKNLNLLKSNINAHIHRL